MSFQLLSVQYDPAVFTLFGDFDGCNKASLVRM